MADDRLDSIYGELREIAMKHDVVLLTPTTERPALPTVDLILSVHRDGVPVGDMKHLAQLARICGPSTGKSMMAFDVARRLGVPIRYTVEDGSIREITPPTDT